MIAFIDLYRDQFGLTPICRTLGATECGFITSRGYLAAKTRPASDRAIRDTQLIEVITRIHQDNYLRLRSPEDLACDGPGRLADRR